MASNYSIFDSFTNYSFDFPNISEDAFNRMDVEQLDLVIDMFSNEQREISDPAFSIIILLYTILVIVAGIANW